jgi:hypothetical protein
MSILGITYPTTGVRGGDLKGWAFSFKSVQIFEVNTDSRPDVDLKGLC